MEEQFKKLTVKILLKNKISIRGLYILDNDRYLYQVFNNCTEEWYMIFKNSFLKLNIIKKVSNAKIRKLYFNIGNNKFISLKMYYNIDKEGRDNISIKLQNNGKKYYSIKDSYLNKMFLDIYRMNI